MNLKKWILLGLTALASNAALADDTLNLDTSSGDWNTYSKGVRMGQLTKFSVRGLFIESAEGELLAGNESTPLKVPYRCGENTCHRSINPWLFSADNTNASIMETLKKSVGQYVVLKYEQKNINNPFAYSTGYRITSATLVDQSITPSACQAPESASGGSRSDGERVGRIIKVSDKGILSKTWEVTMQVGNSGSQFHQMSVNDVKTANCLLTWLKSGKKVSVTYNQSYIYNPLTQETSYQLIKVEAIKTNAPGGLKD